MQKMKKQYPIIRETKDSRPNYTSLDIFYDLNWKVGVSNEDIANAKLVLPKYAKIMNALIPEKYSTLALIRNIEKSDITSAAEKGKLSLETIDDKFLVTCPMIYQNINWQYYSQDDKDHPQGLTAKILPNFACFPFEKKEMLYLLKKYWNRRISYIGDDNFKILVMNKKDLYKVPEMLLTPDYAARKKMEEEIPLRVIGNRSFGCGMNVRSKEKKDELTNLIKKASQA
jgi:hypothetical protein